MDKFDKKLQEAAENYWVSIPSDEDNKFSNKDIIEAFKAGVIFAKATKIWLVTYEVNDYNQCGEYFKKIYKNKPTKEILAKDLEIKLDYAEHILTSGGRKNFEDIWYNLKEIEVV